MRGLLPMILIGLPSLAWAEIVGPARVVDGDTIEVASQVIDLADIDAPELDQLCRRGSEIIACGMVASTQLSDLTAGVAVRCAPTGALATGHVVARCTAGGYDLSEGMVYTGWALAYPRAESPYRRFEEGARAARRGMWRGDFVAPWEWRAGLRLPEAEEK